jgi:hypothetical protein
MFEIGTLGRQLVSLNKIIDSEYAVLPTFGQTAKRATLDTVGYN